MRSRLRWLILWSPVLVRQLRMSDVVKGFGRRPIETLRPKVATEMALHVLAYNLTRVMNIVGIKPLLAAVRA